MTMPADRTIASQRIDQASQAILGAWRWTGHPGRERQEEIKPRNLPEAYGIQETVSRELGPIGAWRTCSAMPEIRLAAAPVPTAALRPEPGRLVAPAGGPLSIRPVLCLRLGRSLPEYEAPFSAREVAAAVEGTVPGVLVPAADGARADAPLARIAEGCGRVALVYGRSIVPGRPEPGRIDFCIESIRRRGRALAEASGSIGDVMATLVWLANFGTHWAGGLLVGQMVVIEIATAEHSLFPERSARTAIGRFGTVGLSVEREQA